MRSPGGYAVCACASASACECGTEGARCETGSDTRSEGRHEPAAERAAPSAPTPLRVGSDCSGMATECFALDALGVAHEHVFCSEVWEPAIRFLRSNKRAKRMYGSVSERSVEEVPAVDLYVCGFPCQPRIVS